MLADILIPYAAMRQKDRIHAGMLICGVEFG